MSTAPVRFETVIGADRVIHLPPGVDVPAGQAEVIILPKTAPPPAPPQEEQSPPRENPRLRAMINRLGNAAKELGISGLPPDLAENHDHYAHGAPKRDPAP